MQKRSHTSFLWLSKQSLFRLLTSVFSLQYKYPCKVFVLRNSKQYRNKIHKMRVFFDIYWFAFSTYISISIWWIYYVSITNWLQKSNAFAQGAFSKKWDSRTYSYPSLWSTRVEQAGCSGRLVIFSVTKNWTDCQRKPLYRERFAHICARKDKQSHLNIML